MITKINGYDLNKYQKRQNISFGSGKVDVYSDFDGTYCPIRHHDLHFASPQNQPDFAKYCKTFKDFFDRTRNGLKFHITTGRTFGEYDSVSNLIKMRGFELPLPDTFIAKNGSDEYLKVGSDEDFYKKGIFPFRYDKTNKEKEIALKNLTGWDGPKIKAKLKEIFKEHNFRIVEADSENGVRDYGDRSLFSSGKLPDERGRIFQGTDKPEWVVGLRNDGNCKIYITYPPDMDTTPERFDVLQDSSKKIRAFLREIGIKKLHGYTKQHDNECCGRLYHVLEPRVDDKLRWSSKKVQNQGLSKLYDTKEAISKAIKNNDLVIVAGDSSNDFDMLNPFQYIDVPEIDIRDDVRDCWDMYKGNPGNLVMDLNPKNPLHTEIIRQLDELPFVGIVVANERKDRPLGTISYAFGKNSRFKKIITVESGHLEDGIKEAIKLYASQNPEYAKKLSPDLKKEIFGIIENPTPIIKKKFKMKYLGFAALALGLLSGIFLLIKKSKFAKQRKYSASSNVVKTNEIIQPLKS